MSTDEWVKGSEKAFKKVEAAMAKQNPDTMPQWMHYRYGSSTWKTDDESKGWDGLSETDKAYWEHEAAAVRRAISRSGFKEKK